MQSLFNKWTIPDEDTDPWFETFFAGEEQKDQMIWALRVRQSLFVIPPALTWTGSQLSWAADWQIVIGLYGRVLNVAFGPDEATRVANMEDGDFLCVEIPYAMSSAETTNFIVTSQLTPNSYSLFPVGVRLAGNFHRLANTTL